jgi:glyoxylase-like metal-dependent hydrolase (beta-lactamase superfamily II)
MTLAIHPLNLGEVEADFSFIAWGTKQGVRVWIPTTVWLITGAEKPILVDASFRDADAFTAASGVPARRSPEQTLTAQLARHNLTPADIGYLVHTHLHHDHTGLDDQLPAARILVQRAELQYAAAPLFPFPFYDRVDIPKLVGPLWNRIEILDGEGELFPGIRTVLTGGHTPAHQMLYVDLPSGTAIITGDAAYVADINVTQQVPMGYFVNLADVMAGLRRIARDGTHILPMHDAAVYERYADGVR